MGERRKYGRKIDAGVVRLSDRKYKVTIAVSAYVVAPDEFTGSVTVDDVDEKPRVQAKDPIWGTETEPFAQLQYSFESVETLIERYATVKENLAAIDAEHALRYGIVQYHSNVEVVHGVLTLWGDEGEWHTRRGQWLHATVEETDAAVAHLADVIGKLRSIPPPAAHTTDHDDLRRHLEEEAEQRRELARERDEERQYPQRPVFSEDEEQETRETEGVD